MLPENVNAIIDQYVRNGWRLRLVLTDSGETKFPIMDDVDVAASEMDGLWFSRKRHDGSETWELRRLFGTPFAMLAVIDDDMTTEEAARTLSEIESRMAATSLKISGKNKFA